MTNLLRTAVANNARWCDVVCRRSGLETRTDDRLWWTSTRSPDGYPDAVTLHPGVPVADVLGRIDTSVGCSVKDSYAELDLGSSGFRVLFDATWIARPAAVDRPLAGSSTGSGGGDTRAGLVEERAGPLRLDWQPVSTPDELAEWAAGHGQAGALGLDLTGPDLRLLAGRRHGRLVAGVAFNLSDPAVDPVCVGVSNLFVLEGDEVQVWLEVVSLAGRVFPGRPLVGYERGAELEVALAAGFAPLGPLRVWMS